MGKTYVALGAFALFRHFNPGFRLLVIAPKENIQQKWTKELRISFATTFDSPTAGSKPFISCRPGPPFFATTYWRCTGNNARS